MQFFHYFVVSIHNITASTFGPQVSTMTEITADGPEDVVLAEWLLGLSMFGASPPAPACARQTRARLGKVSYARSITSA